MGENLVVLCSVRRYFWNVHLGEFSQPTSSLVGLTQYSTIRVRLLLSVCDALIA